MLPSEAVNLFTKNSKIVTAKTPFTPIKEYGGFNKINSSISHSKGRLNFLIELFRHIWILNILEFYIFLLLFKLFDK